MLTKEAVEAICSMASVGAEAIEKEPDPLLKQLIGTAVLSAIGVILSDAILTTVHGGPSILVGPGGVEIPQEKEVTYETRT